VVLDEFSKRTGLEKMLKSCFPETHRQILAMANYLAIEGGTLSHCESWAKSSFMGRTILMQHHAPIGRSGTPLG